MQLQKVQHKIYTFRDHKVMLDFDLAELYEVETRVLNQSVKRNINRFPDDFMFQISEIELKDISSQIVMTSAKRPKTALPYAFTEQGIAMLSGILKSEKAIAVNISIMRAFVLMRKYALTHEDLTAKLKHLEDTYNKQFRDVFEAINYLIEKDKLQEVQTTRKKIGYKLKQTI